LKTVTFRADGSSAIGFGHIYRCLSISEMLGGSFKMNFAVHNADQKTKELISNFGVKAVDIKDQSDLSYAGECDVVVVDGYWHTSSYIQQLMEKNKVVVEIDDIPKEEYHSHLIINHALGANYNNSKFSIASKLLSGPKYAMLRKEFLNRTDRKKEYKSPSVVTISMGGSDPNNYTLKLVRALSALYSPLIQKVNILVGAGYRYLESLQKEISTQSTFTREIHSELSADQVKELMDDASLFLCPASTIAYEACAIGIPIVAFLSAPNQVNLYEGMVSAKAVAAGGDIAVTNLEQLSHRLADIINNYRVITGYISAQRELIDGRSGERIKKEILMLCH
jgi:UDP-2,4-diacetamido-2,4,6-trideoxy-beta-L-altropyranose hydrolase